MGIRRNDISSEQRAQIAITMLGSVRPHRTASQLAGNYAGSRQAIYNIATKGQEVLRQGLQPGPHGPHWAEKTIRVDDNRLRRGSVVLTEAGVSQPEVRQCLAELLDTKPSLILLGLNPKVSI